MCSDDEAHRYYIHKVMRRHIFNTRDLTSSFLLWHATDLYLNSTASSDDITDNAPHHYSILSHLLMLKKIFVFGINFVIKIGSHDQILIFTHVN